MKRYGRGDIEALTENFTAAVGCGGFSTVYLGQLSGGGSSVSSASRCLTAVKVHYGSDWLNLAFKQELDILLRLCHGYIVSRLGYVFR